MSCTASGRHWSRTCLGLLLWPSLAWAAGEASGLARVIDGDTLHIGDIKVRMHGIDAPENDQTCNRDSKDWACGKRSTKHLRDLIGGRKVHCTWQEQDRYGRALGVCQSGEQNLNAAQVAAGLAVAYRRYSNDYVALEEQARTTGKGIWTSTFDMPWDHRAGTDSDAQLTNTPIGDCHVKGNINRKNDRIYHVRGSRWYAKISINPNKGERCFATESEALAAGFRKAGSR